MRILVVGAGAIGGYFGARLATAGRDVTFLVRPRRASALAQSGLQVRSALGDVSIATPQLVASAELTPDYGLIVLSCKAYDLEAAADDIANAVKPGTIILPLLNGLRHIEVLSQRFPGAVVLGGQCVISTTLDDAGTIVHLNAVHSVTYGARDAADQTAADQTDGVLQGAGFDVTRSPAIMQAMWNKWIVLASMAGATSTMRAPVGVINRAPGGQQFILDLIDEVASLATSAGYVPSSEYLAEVRTFLTDAQTGQTSSMYRDIQGGARIEADHIIGDLLVRARGSGVSCPALQTVYAHLKAYELQRIA